MKKFISIILVFAMILSLSSIALAAEAEKDFIIDEENTTVQILTSAGWDYITGEGDYNSWTVEVLADIEVTKAFATFTGTLVGKEGGVDGVKPTITNKINSGLISTLSTGTVKDLIIEGSITAESGNYIGSLANKICDTTTASTILISGIENNCSVTLQAGSGAGMIGRLAYNSRTEGNNYIVKIENCENTANMATSSNYCGGIIGSLNAPTKAIEGDTITVKNCDNYGTISGGEYVGGIIGGNATAHNAEYTFESCSNYGKIAGTANSVGGMAGAIFGADVIILKCANYANVASTGNYVAGIVGYDVNVNISETFNEGAISGANYVGGFVGRLGIKSGTNPIVMISDCYNSGSIIADTYAAGFISYNYLPFSKLKLKNVYNIGEVKLTGTKTTYYRINGKISLVDGADVDVGNIYYLEGLAGSDTYPVDGGKYNTLEANTTAGFEKLPDGFSDTIWASLEGGYPILKNNLPTEANGTPITYHTVTLDNGENGTAYKDTVTYVKEGTSYTLTVKPNDDYQVDEVTNLIPIGDNRYQTETVTSDMTVSVTYKAIPQDEDEITGAETAFSSDAFESDDGTVNAVNLVHFARFAVKDGVTALYGIQLSNDNFVTVLNEGLADSDYNGQYGVRFYGTKIIKGGTYYLRPYVSYDDGLTYTYGEIVIYTIPVNN